jgi:hypothetical protein
MCWERAQKELAEALEAPAEVLEAHFSINNGQNKHF